MVADAAAPYDPPMFAPRRVLIADDDESVRQLLTAFFDKTYADRGYVIEAVADGTAAIEAVRRSPPSCCSTSRCPASTASPPSAPSAACSRASP
jgi:DNA-binding NtrC family response regulator